MENRKKPLNGIIVSAILLLVFAVLIFFVLYNNEEVENFRPFQKKEFTCKTENDKCLKCHGQNRYEISDPADSAKILLRRMKPEYIIDTVRYCSANHWDFKCIDCHSEEYQKQPHDSKLKYLPLNSCLDCHADDEKFAKFHFENIDTAFRKSTHYLLDSNNFSCWHCHDPHYNKVRMRDSTEDIRQMIAYDNFMCLDCHDKNSNNLFEYFSDSTKPDMAEVHKWLPQLENHFNNVRCIDCHAELNDSLLVSHKIVSKAESIKECGVCHSENSLLLKTLYKNRLPSGENKYGFLNPVILDDQFIIGINKNPALNNIMLSILALALAIIIIHVVFRISIKNNK